ncbi:MAG: hypothetical protein A3G87_01795 [Omnitrophica bacterium RIFCSPLOWO2_12_FULL_50_11]|nr:MAG: hypothetical protein A3G87_01795 [Omnitrophica bacterium RIFCSPLOWO2_12_FULL_50_11]
MGKFVKVAARSEIAPGTAKKVEVNGKEVAVFHIDGRFYAIGETCPHRGGPLSEGTVEEKVVTCPWHGWQFDVTDGVSPVNPAAKVDCYPVKLEGDDVTVSDTSV